MSRSRSNADAAKDPNIQALNQLGIADIQPVPVNEAPALEPLSDEALLNAIQHYRSLDFDFVGEKKGRKVLIKINRDPLDPIHPHEARIQALRYMRGALLIINNKSAINKEDQTELIGQLTKAYNDLYNDKDPHTFINTIAVLLMNKFNLDSFDQASSDLSKAKNIGELLENHPDIVTCSNSISSNGQHLITVETASLLKIEDSFYDNEMQDFSHKEWFRNTKFVIPDWAGNIFYRQFQQMRQLGVPAPSSARWLPLPCNAQKVMTVLFNAENPGQIVSSSTWHRIGTIGLSNQEGDDNKKMLAERQLNTLINLTQQTGIDVFKERYKGLYNPENFTVYFSYQTLLSPIKGEARLGHVDNNGKFVAITNAVVSSKNASTSNNTNPRIVYLHTNTAINSLADKLIFGVSIIKESPEARRILQDKIAATEQILRTAYGDFDALSDSDKNDPAIFAEKICSGRNMMSPDLKNEIYLRAYAYICINKLLNNKEPYNQLPVYQRNLMLSALEFHLMGSQAITLAGCKSARDRTAIFGAAVKTMQENPAAMQDWNTLNAGITQSLTQGHHFRAISYHCAVAKVGAVHKDYFNQLSEATRAKIKNWGQFTKKHAHAKPPLPLSDQHLTNTASATAAPASSVGLFAKQSSSRSPINQPPIIGNRTRR